MKNMAAIGPSVSVMLFQSIGIDAYIIQDGTQLKNKIEELSNTTKVIFIAESLSPFLADVVNKYKEQTYPILLFVPLEGIKTEMGIEKLRKEVEKAIGMALL